MILAKSMICEKLCDRYVSNKANVLSYYIHTCIFKRKNLMTKSGGLKLQIDDVYQNVLNVV